MQLVPLQQGCPRLPHVRQVPLEQVVPELHELPLQHGSPLLPQCWHVLPGPNWFGLHTLKVNEHCDPAQHG
jgi:hypothetical protein